MSKKSKVIYLFISIIFFILLNVYLSDLILSEVYKSAESSVFSITYVQNQGAAFNIFDGQKLFLIGFSLFAIIGILFYIIKNIAKYSAITLFFTSLLVAGIFNNMAERAIFGFVRDFIKLNFVDFPVFNISDIFINIGVWGIIFIIIKRSFKKTA